MVSFPSTMLLVLMRHPHTRHTRVSTPFKHRVCPWGCVKTSTRAVCCRCDKRVTLLVYHCCGDQAKQWCLYIDFLKLNLQSIKDSLPNLEETFSAASGSKWCTVLDLKSGYNQIEVEEADKGKTVFGNRGWTKRRHVIVAYRERVLLKKQTG